MKGRDPVGILFIVVAAAGFGLLGPFARVAGDLGFQAATLAIWRSVVSVVALGTAMLVGVALHRLQAAPWSSISRADRLELMAMGAFVAGTTLGLFLAFERISIVLALIVFYTFPMLVAVSASYLGHEPLGGRRLMAILFAVLGMVLVVGAPGADGESRSLDIVGMGLAFGAALCQTGYALVAARGFVSVPTFQASTLLRVFSLMFYVVLLLPIVLVLGGVDDLFGPLGSVEAWLVVLIIGIFGAALPTALLVAGYRRIGPTRGAVLMLFEPVVGVGLAALWIAERPAPAQMVGGLMVLIGAALVQLSGSPRPITAAAGTGE